LRADGRSFGTIPTLLPEQTVEAVKNEILAKAAALRREETVSRIIDLAAWIKAATAKLRQLKSDEIVPEFDISRIDQMSNSELDQLESRGEQISKLIAARADELLAEADAAKVAQAPRPSQDRR